MPSVQLQQQSVLRSISINRQTCGDHVEDVSSVSVGCRRVGCVHVCAFLRAYRLPAVPHTHTPTPQVILSEPVLITGLTVLVPHGAERQVFKAWARDLSTPAAARFTPIIGPVEGPCEAAPVAQVPHIYTTHRDSCALIALTTRNQNTQQRLASTSHVCLVLQVFPTQHVVLRGKCSSATLQLVGYTLDSAPERIKVGVS